MTERMFRAKHIVRKDYPGASADTRVKDVEDSLHREGFVVITDIKPPAIVTHRSLIKSGHVLLGDCIHDLSAVDPETTFDFILQTMDRESSHVLPVVVDNYFCGVVVREDITKLLHEIILKLDHEVKEKSGELKKANKRLQAEVKAHRKTIRNLCESEERFRTIFNVVPAAICMHNASGLLYLNPFAQSLLDYDSSNGLCHLERAEADRLKKRLQNLLQTRNAGKLLELNFTKRDGSTVSMEAVTELTLIDGEECLVSIALDSSDRNALRSTIENDQLRFRNIIDNLSEGVWYVDSQLITTYANKALCELWSVKPENVIGRSVFDLIAKANKSQAAQMLQAVMQGKRVTRTFCPAKGNKRWLHISAVPDYSQNGVQQGCIAVLVDISGIIQSQEQLQITRDHFIKLADSISEIFFSLDNDFRITYWGRSAAKRTGFPVEEAIGKKIFDLLPQGNVKRAVSLCREVMQTKIAKRTRYRYRDLIYSIDIYPFGNGVSVIAHNRSDEFILESSKIALQERELKDIGQKVHNGVGQYLAALSMRCAELQERVKQGMPVELPDVESIHSICIDANESVHDLTQTFLLKAGEDLSDYDTIQSLCEDIEKTHGVRIIS